MKLDQGTKVWVAFGLEGDVLAEVVEVYGPPHRKHVLVRLTPELSGDVVGEPVSFSVPEDSVRESAPAA